MIMHGEIRYEPGGRTHIATAVAEACLIAKKMGRPVMFKFNRIELTAYKDTRPVWLINYYKEMAAERAKQDASEEQHS